MIQVPSEIASILIVEDSPDSQIWLQGIVREMFPQAEVYTATLLAEGKNLLMHHQPEFALIDLQLPDGNGTELLQLCMTEPKQTCGIVCTVHDDDQHIFSAMQAGAVGYILKGQRRKAFMADFSAILQGRPPLTPIIAHRLLNFFHRQKENTDDAVAYLTPREEQVLTLIGKGLQTKQAAHQLGLTVHTTSDYIKAIYKKLNINTRAEAAIEAQRRGFIGK